MRHGGVPPLGDTNAFTASQSTRGPTYSARAGQLPVHEAYAPSIAMRCNDMFDDELDDEWSADFDLDEDDEGSDSEVLPCPNCGTDVYEDALQCPACGNYISLRPRVWSGRGWWWILLGLLGIVATILVLAGVAGCDPRAAAP